MLPGVPGNVFIGSSGSKNSLFDLTTSTGSAVHTIDINSDFYNSSSDTDFVKYNTISVMANMVNIND